MIQYRLKPYPYLETFFLRQSGNGSAPETEAGAFDAAGFNNAANWTTALAADDGLIGPRDRVAVLDLDGDISAQLVVQASGLDDSRPITLQGRGIVRADGGIDLNSKVFIVIEDLNYAGMILQEDGTGGFELEDGSGVIKKEE
jgi:hypothetical protein